MVESAFYDPAIVLVKISILLQYVTVFVVHRKSFFHYLIHVIIWGNVIFYVVVTFYFLFRVSLGSRRNNIKFFDRLIFE